jgi:hypothetical protein
MLGSFIHSKPFQPCLMFSDIVSRPKEEDARVGAGANEINFFLRHLSIGLVSYKVCHCLDLTAK